MKNSLFIAVLLFSFVGVYAQKTMSPVASVSKVHFTIKNFGIKVGGDFSGLQGSIAFDPKLPAAGTMDVTIDANTIDTDNERRDKHLRSEDFFEVEKYPTIHIKSTKITTTNKTGNFILYANLTIKNVTQAIAIPFTVTNTVAGFLFSGSFSIDRLQYHVGESSATMSDEVNIELNVIAK